MQARRQSLVSEGPENPCRGFRRSVLAELELGALLRIFRRLEGLGEELGLSRLKQGRFLGCGGKDIACRIVAVVQAVGRCQHQTAHQSRGECHGVGGQHRANGSRGEVGPGESSGLDQIECARNPHEMTVELSVLLVGARETGQTRHHDPTRLRQLLQEGRPVRTAPQAVEHSERLSFALFPDPTGTTGHLDDALCKAAHWDSSAGRAGDFSFFGHQWCSHSFAKMPSICGLTRLPSSSVL